ncbi:MAG: hypothetical protein WBE21_14505, partial [Candidatus Acidiferrales bacterium]
MDTITTERFNNALAFLRNRHRVELSQAASSSHEHTVQLRALVDARNSDDAWNLKCLIRERLIQFLQEKYLGSLPRIRGEINAGPNDSPLEQVPYPE